MRNRKRKRKNIKLLLALVILGISIGFAYLSTTLSIDGIAGIKGNKWSIHWDDTSIKTTEGSITPKTAAYVTDAKKENVDFAVELELPGDFYEFTVDAINDGTVAGKISKVDYSFYKDGTAIEKPDYYIFTVTHADGSEIDENEILPAGAKKGYKVRVEFDKEATELPDEEDTEIEIKTSIGPTDPTKYLVEFNPNGGISSQLGIEVEKEHAIGTMPTATKGESQLLGWYTEITGGTKVTGSYVPTSDMKLYAHWVDSYSMFDTGKTVNAKLKQLAGNSEATYETKDYNITKIAKATTAPDLNTMTDNNIISSENSPTPIYAWYDDNGTIYWWSESDKWLNEDASSMFYNFNSLRDLDTTFNTNFTTNMYGMFSGLYLSELDLSSFDTSNVTNMSGMFNSFKFTDTKELDLSSFDISNVTNMGGMFYGSGLTSINLSSFDTSNVEDMAGMFSSCSGLTSLDLSGFDISNATSIGGMFGGSSSLETLNISGWNFAKATNISGLFSGLGSLKEINLSGVNTSNVTSMSGLFSGSSSIEELDLSGFDISNVTSISGLVSGCNSLKKINISGWNFAKATELFGLFAGLSNLEEIDLTDVNTSNVTAMGGLFQNCMQLKTLDLSSFDISNVTNIDGIFNKCNALKKINISGWNFAKATSISGLFAGLSNLEEIDLTNVNTSEVTEMEGLFQNCMQLKTLDLGSFDTRKVTNMYVMFSGCTSLKTIYVSDDFVVDQVTSSNEMFKNAYAITGENGTTYSSSHIDKEYAHYDGGTTNPGYFNKVDSNIYTVTFDANGGEVSPATMGVRGNKKIGELPTPTYKKHVFEGWHVGSVDGTLIDETYKVSNEVTLVAKWRDAEQYTVTFNANGGEVAEEEATRIVYEGEKIGEFPNVTRENYYVYNWRLGTTDGTIIDSTYIPSADISIYANWKVNFSEAPVSAISEIAKNDNLCIDFNLGDTREIVMDGKTNVLRISNCSYNELYNTRSKSQSANGLVIEFANGIGNRRMNTYDESLGNVNGNGIKGGWEYSEMREYLNTTVYNSLPSEWQETIIDTRVISGSGPLDSANFITSDKLYLLSPGEVLGGSDTGDGRIHDNGQSATKQLDFYKSISVRRRWDSSGSAEQKARKGIEYEDYYSYHRQIDWWLRNVDYADSYNINAGAYGAVHSALTSSAWYMSYGFGDDGSRSSATYDGFYAQVSPAFRIGTEDIPTHTITLNYNDNVTESTTIKVVDGKIVGTLPTPERNGYTFDGWYTGLTDGTKINANYIPDDSIQIYAHWS